MRLSEVIPKILAIVKEFEDKGGISKNNACVILMNRHGGSRSTYWKGFEYLLGKKGGHLIESKVVPPNKQQAKLFPTGSYTRLDEFNKKLEYVNGLFDLIEENPSVGDCYFDDIDPNSLNKFFKDFVYRTGDSIYKRKNNKKERRDLYSLQARHDLLEKIPLFLYDYLQDPNNGLTKVKEECLKNCHPIIERCLKILQQDYLFQTYYSFSFEEDLDLSVTITDVRGTFTSGIESDFLRILGRYYFLISKQFAQGFKIDSCNEQKIISNFTKAFYPRKKYLKGFDPKKKVFVESDKLYDYNWKTIDDLNETKDIFPVKPKNSSNDSLGKRIVDFGDFDDPIGIIEYYLNWLITLKVFSSVELGIILSGFIMFIPSTMQKHFKITQKVVKA